MTSSPFLSSSSPSRAIETPHEFSSCELTNPPFAAHAPVEGWPRTEESDAITSSVEYTLIFVVDTKQRKVLLGLKRRGMGVDLYNGFGGKVERVETVHDCAARELEEESGLIPKHDGLYYKGCLFSSRPQSGKGNFIIKIHFFACVAWAGEPIPTEEMIPQWFEIPETDSPQCNRLPLDRMWPEASFYLLPVLESIFRNNRSDLFISRINYRYLRQAESPTSLPALDGVTIRKTSSNEKAHDDDIAERLSSWWMCFAPRRSLQDIALW